jgi:hypothetical protein
MSLTTDNVRPSPLPNAWRIGKLTIAGVFIGISELVFCTAVLAIAKFRLGFGIETLRTLAFVLIVFDNQATTYTNRERQRMGSCRPSLWLVGSSRGRLADRLDAGDLGNRHESSAYIRCRRNLRGGNRVCVPLGFCESPGVQSAEDRIETLDSLIEPKRYV